MFVPRTYRSAVVGACLAALALLYVGITIAQEAPTPAVMGPDGKPLSPEQMKAMMDAKRGGHPPGQPGQPQPGAKPDDKGKKAEGEGEKKKGDAGDSVKRSDKPPRDPDPREFDVALDEKGRVPPFNFIGQPWPDVMQWFANLSKSSLDWQELPTGYLNLTTQRSYSLDEVRDEINRLLHTRGYTSIQSGEILSVFKIDKLDPALVRRATEDELYDLRPYDFVKVSFELPEGMEVDKAKEDVKQVLSPSAKVFPLVTTRRLLLMDAVANLRTVSELFNQERMFQDSRIVPTEFVLRYARPEQVIEILYVVLGVDPKAKPAQTDPQQMQQMQQMMQQAQQRGQDVSKMMPKADAPKVYLAYNRRRNSILVNAPPKEMKVIEQTIQFLDVPYGTSGLAADDSATGAGERTLVKYNLVTMDPEQLKLTLEEVGELDPRTELRADTKAKILFARATEADHHKIKALQDELDGTGRKLHVKWLPRHLPADAVAGTVMALMGGQEEEEQQQFPFYYYSYRRGSDDDKPKKGFRIDADIENNRVLLWANDAEIREVERFLAELSKASPAVEAERTVRTLDAMDPEATARLLEQLRRAWPALGQNELIIDDARKPKDTKAPKKDSDDEQKKDAKDRAASSTDFSPSTELATGFSPSYKVQLVQLTSESADAEDEDVDDAPSDEASNAKADPRGAPVTITITEDGRLLIASQDTAALDRVEQFIEQAGPPGQRYKIFHIKYADVYDVYLNLKEYYEDELKGDSKQILDWWGYYQDAGPKDGSLLSKRRTLRLIWDPASNSILVANATTRQLSEIDKLISEYEQAAQQRDDTATERVTRPIKVHYSRASTIVAAVKEVYRDLLSSKDKEFDSKDQKGSSSSSGITVLRYSPFSGSDEGTKKSAPVKVGFQGALSLGADDVSNIVLVSAQKEVFEGVEAMIRELDNEAAPKTTVQVHRVNGNVTAAALQKALNDAVGKAWLGNRPEQTGTSGQGEQKKEGDQNRDRDRGDRRRGRDADND